MRTSDGWVRGTQCGKAFAEAAPPTWVCVHCGRSATSPNALCYPSKVNP